jgi:hypothetical protein
MADAEHIHEQERDIGKLWGFARELKAWAEGKVREVEIILIGVDGTNGLRGNIRKLEEDVDIQGHQLQAGIEWGNRVWEIERKKPGGCLGIEAVEKLEARLAAEHAATDKLILESRKARYTMLTGLGVGLLAAASPIVLELVK